MDVLIDKAKCGDIGELAELYDALNDYLSAHKNYPGWIKGVYPTRVEAAHFFETDTLYTAKLCGRIVGSMALSHEPEQEPVNGQWQVTAEDDAVFVIHVFVVHPEFIRQGVGSAMLEFAEELGRRQSIRAIRLDVYEKNTPAIKAYEKHGYQYIDTVDLGLGQYGLDWFRLYERVIAPYENKLGTGTAGGVTDTGACKAEK